MSTATQVTVEEYLATTWRPDCDYVDGEVLERNLGQTDHSELQGETARGHRAARDYFQGYGADASLWAWFLVFR